MKKGEIMLHPTVIYTDGIREQFEAVRLTEKGVIIGRIIDGEFVDCGFISKRNVKEIKNNGGKEDGRGSS
jgi:hypothetical protein